MNRIKGNVFWSFSTLFSVFIILVGYQNCSQKQESEDRKLVTPLCQTGVNSDCARPPVISLPLFLSPLAQGMDTFARIINPSSREVTVSVFVLNGENESLGSRLLSVGANSVVHFNSSDLSQGNADLGWTTGLNITDPGFLRLKLTSWGIFRLEFIPVLKVLTPISLPYIPLEKRRKSPGLRRGSIWCPFIFSTPPATRHLKVSCI